MKTLIATAEEPMQEVYLLLLRLLEQKRTA